MKKLLFLLFIALLGISNSIAQDSHAITISSKIAPGLRNTSYFTYTNESGVLQTVPLGYQGTSFAIKVKSGTYITIRLFTWPISGISGFEMIYASVSTWMSTGQSLICVFNFKAEDSQIIDYYATIPPRATFECNGETVTRDIIDDNNIIEVWIASEPSYFNCCNDNSISRSGVNYIKRKKPYI